MGRPRLFNGLPECFFPINGLREAPVFSLIVGKSFFKDPDLSTPWPKFLPVELSCCVLTLVLRISELPVGSLYTAAEFVLMEKKYDKVK